MIEQRKHINSVAKNNELSLALGFKLQKYVYTNMVKRLNNARYFWGRVSNFNQSEARMHCFLVSDWLKFETIPRKYRIL